MAGQWERVDEDTEVGPLFGQDPPPSFSAPTPASSLQKKRRCGRPLRQLKGESRTAAEVVMDDALVQEDGIDLIVAELDRCWEVTQDQDKASKIEKAFFETQCDAKSETTLMSYVARRKLKFQQLENAPGKPLPAVIKGYATLRDAKLKVVLSCVRWCGWVALRCDLEQVGKNGKTVPDVLHRPRSGCSDTCSGFRGLDTAKYRPTTLERSSRRLARGRRVLRGRRNDDFTRRSDRHSGCSDDGQETTVEENEVPQILLQTRPAFRHPG